MNSQRSNDIALLLLRVAFGGLMAINHGLGKAQKVMDGNFAFADPLGMGEKTSLVLASGAELFCAALIAVGLFTRLSAIPLIFTMAVAAFVVHGADPLAKKEMALIYLAGYVAIFLLGSGRISLQTLIADKIPGSKTWARFLLG